MGNEDDEFVDAETMSFRTKIFGRVILTCVMQSLVSILIVIEGFYNYRTAKAKNAIVEWEATWIMMSRFICCIMMHATLTQRVRHGLDIMKYAVNHPWKFDNWSAAYLAGLA